MKRYLVLSLMAALLLPMLVVPVTFAQKQRQRLAPASGSSRAAKQNAAPQPQQIQRSAVPVSRQAAGFAESAPLRDLPDAPRTPEQTSRERLAQRGAVEREIENRERFRETVPNYRPQADGALQRTVEPTAAEELFAPQALPTPSLVITGNSSDDNNTLGFGRLSPPDTNGDVGPNHYVQVVNLTIRIWDKNGNPLTPVKKFSSIFSALGSPCGSVDDGDPIALYDPMADRWLLSQFCFPFGDTTPPYFQEIAVSKTSDPTGAYYLYNFQMPNTEFNDYPHFGVWPDGYYMTDNQFLNGGTFNDGGSFAFDRAKMLAGDPAASYIYFNMFTLFPKPGGGTQAVAGMLPADMDGFNPPPAGTPCPFAYFTATEFGDAIDGMRIFDFHADFANPANSTFIERPESAIIPAGGTYPGGIPVAAFDPTETSTGDSVPQPAPATSGANLNALADRLMHRFQYRNFGDHESLVVTHTVDVDATTAYRAAIRYYEFRRNTPGSGAWGVNEQATYAGPANDTTHRWLGSAAMNAAGDIAVGYSASSTSVFPSLRYAARYATDAPNGLQQGEQTLFAGTGVQTSTGSRWGDYSNLSVDPSDDCTYWFTSETYTAASQAASSVGWTTRIARFNINDANHPCVAAPHGKIVGVVTNSATGQPVQGATITATNGFLRGSDATGNYAIDPLPPGSYNMVASAPGYGSATASGITVTNGGTVIQNFVLTAMPIIQAAGSQLVYESCPNNSLDPGEIVTVNLSLKNVGTANTVALVGAMQSGGNVSNPPGPQNFGAAVAGGPNVTVPYTFRVNPSATCGSAVTPTLSLTDGANNLGTVVYNFTTGVLQTSLTQAFDTVTAPALPSGWTATRPTGTAALWTTSTTSADTAPNCAFVPNTSGVTDNRLDSPAIPITTSSAVLTFRNSYVTDSLYDGMVLEISIPSVSSGAFQDIITAGGSFVSGGYNATLNGLESNPLGSRQAWTGSSGGYITTKVNLPASAAGQNIILRWRFGSGSSVSSTGARIDGATLQDGYQCCSGSLPLPDMSGDGKADIAVFHPLSTDSSWLIRNSATGLVSGTNWGIGTGGNPDKPVPADYDGNGTLDVAVWRPTDGNWYILGNPAGAIGWGQLGDVPAPADYDGDGKADIAVFRPSDGNWYIRRSTGGVSVVGWGNATDKLVPADYDGDGKADVAVFRPNEGTWYIKKSTGGASVIGWGDANDTPAPADYDGDKKADIAVFRGTEGNWYIQKTTGGATVTNWGNSADTPVPADYDGDKKADIAIYRPAENNWYIVNSSTGTAVILNLGSPGDRPISTGIIPQ